MNINKPLVAAFMYCCATATIAATAPNLYFPSHAYEKQGFDKQEKLNAEKRQQMIGFMTSQGDDAAKVGIAYSQADWMALYRSVASITGPDLSGEFLELLRRNQNAKAAQVRQQR